MKAQNLVSEINKTDNTINAMINELYGLSLEEINVVNK